MLHKTKQKLHEKLWVLPHAPYYHSAFSGWAQIYIIFTFAKKNSERNYTKC
jgi:hypothetical protein